MSTAPDFHEVEPRYPGRDECEFYHSVELPGEGVVAGQWDLRPATDAYLGHVDFAGRSVLEIGPASGYLSFHMERAGADVTCIEPPMSHLWDKVPFETFDTAGWTEEFAGHIRGVRNSFWYCHHLHRSRVRMVETDPYAIPEAIGEFDIGVLASILLHSRSPFDILEQTARRVTGTMIVTEGHNPDLGDEAICRFLPHRGVPQIDTWWQFSPAFFVSALGLLGFTETAVLFHHQRQVVVGHDIPMYTVIGARPSRPATSTDAV